MPIIELEQNTPEWLEFRKGKIGSTMAATICCKNPFETPLELWSRCIGISAPIEENDAMREGKRLEPLALKKFNEEKGLDMKPAVYVNPLYNYIYSSLDGYNGKELLEIKCSRKLYQNATNGIIPEYYKYQIQHHLMVAGCEHAYYYAYCDSCGYCLHIYRDEEIINEILEKELEFYKCITEYRKPAYG